MTSVISKFIIKTLCDHQGCLDFQRLDETIAQNFTVAEPVMRSVLFDDGKIAIKAGSEKVTGGQIISSDSLVVAKTSLRICQKKPGECPQCDSLHLCRYFVCGDCTYGQKCKNPHSLASPYNAELLKKYGLQDLTEKQLFQLLLQNDPWLLPEICPHYNKGSGLHGSCKFNTACIKLHICQHYFQGDCMFGTSCKRAHNIDAQGTKIFRGFSQENIRNLHEIYRNKFIIMGQWATPVPVSPKVRIPIQDPSHQASHKASKQPSHGNPGSPTSSACPSKPMCDADRDEICLFFIRRHCSFKEKCVRVHWHLPYRWQVLDSDHKTWKDLPNMEDIEKAYCDPGLESDMNQPLPISGIFGFLRLQSPPVVQSVNFKTMTYEGSPVRRLSTASSVSKPPHFILTTEWLWYWKDDTGIWMEFGQGDLDTPASVTSETLENVYLADRDTEIPFSAGRQKYILHFKGEAGTQQMYQENLKHKTKREVKRRPRFVSAHDVKLKLDSTSSPSSKSSSSTAECVPSHWDKSALPDFGYKLVPISKSVKDYDMIEMLFKRTMPHSKINSIKRIQNPSLWKVFQWQKDQMKLRNGGTDVNQMYLFHGTDESLIEAICEQNFDWRMCGVHGTAYGKGSYFAKDASYSDRYASIKRSMNKIMFVALVLVGEYSRGASNYVRPPPKGKGRTLYDSCVDSESNPSIYVVFEKQQIYPEYVIDYS
ncbi:poly [ADP-ribose] polymerase 12 [Seriola lalandi dorsalis]|uniref:Poly (ADP-ribose) polymerase family, member 12a n=1 Tax=Seriola lalandi dorsalis TaxID=1841481 RepID=A0A3B4X8M7_SERLL|nr:poly [ADP-ribose] polymerase 12 [Seriola lalandi dorsalis]